MTQDEKDPIIEMYLKRSWSARIGRFLLFAMILTVMAGAGAYYYYAVSSTETRDELRAASPMVEKTVAFMDERGWIPLAPEELEAQEQARKEVAAKPQVKVNMPKVWDETTPVEKLTTPEQRAKQEQADADLARYAELEAKVAAGEVVDLSEFGEIQYQSTPSKERSLLSLPDDLNGFFDGSTTSLTVTNMDGSSRTYSGEALTALQMRANERFKQHQERAEQYLAQATAPVYWKAWDAKDPLVGDDFLGVVPEEKAFRDLNAHANYSIQIAFSRSPMDYTIFPYFDMTLSAVAVPELVPAFIAQAQLHFDLAEVYARTMRELASRNAHVLRGRGPRQIGGISAEAEREEYQMKAQQYQAFRREISQIYATFDETGHKMIADLRGPDRIKMYHAWRSDIDAKLKQFEAFKLDVDWEKMRNSRQAEAIFYAAQLKERGDGGMTASEKHARKWYQYATNVDSDHGANNLARMYLMSAGKLDRDPVKAFNLLKKAVEVNSSQSAVAQFNLGIMYLRGIGTSKDEEKAIGFLGRASRRSDLAMYALEQMEKEPLKQVDTSQLGGAWRATND